MNLTASWSCSDPAGPGPGPGPGAGTEPRWTPGAGPALSLSLPPTDTDTATACKERGCGMIRHGAGGYLHLRKPPRPSRSTNLAAVKRLCRGALGQLHRTEFSLENPPKLQQRQQPLVGGGGMAKGRKESDLTVQASHTFLGLLIPMKHPSLLHPC